MNRLGELVAHAHAAGRPMHICIVNDPGSSWTTDDFQRAVLACAVQLQRDVAPEYGLPLPIVQALAPGETPPTEAEVAAAGHVRGLLCVVASIPDDPTAQGWHQPLGAGEAFDGYISTEGIDNDGRAECLSHELGEIFVDPLVDQTATALNGDVFPLEPFDATQAGGAFPNMLRVLFDLGDGQPPVMLGNFVLESYWNSATPAGSRVDFLGLLPGPFSIGPHGYSAITKSDGTTTDVFGADGERLLLPVHKLHAASRIQRRLAAMRMNVITEA